MPEEAYYDVHSQNHQCHVVWGRAVSQAWCAGSGENEADPCANRKAEKRSREVR
jgi:hypothetical protein